jgi:hypothetical protein
VSTLAPQTGEAVIGEAEIAFSVESRCCHNDPGTATGVGFTPHYDFYVLIEGGEKMHEALDRKALHKSPSRRASAQRIIKLNFY